jgi:hypothetical protein
MKIKKEHGISRRGVFSTLTGAAFTVAGVSNSEAQSIEQPSRNSAVNAIIRHAVSTGEENFIVVSKNPNNPDGQPRLYLVENGKIINNFVIGVGENQGDSNDSLTNKATPVGHFNIRIANDRQALTMSGMPVIDFLYSPDGLRGAAIHSTYLAEFNSRQAKINTQAGSDNLFSNGCINISPENMRIVLDFVSTRRLSLGSNILPRLWVAPTDERPQNLNRYLNIPLSGTDLSRNVR